MVDPREGLEYYTEKQELPAQTSAPVLASILRDKYGPRVDPAAIYILSKMENNIPKVRLMGIRSKSRRCLNAAL